jgi:predicted MPP superfamily phosphohydrolase
MIIFFSLFLIDGLIFLLLLFYNKKVRKIKNIIIFHSILSIIAYLLLSWCFFIKIWTSDPNEFAVFYKFTNHAILLYISKMFFVIPFIFILIFRKQFVFNFSLTLFFLSLVTLLFGLYVGRFHYVIKNIDLTSNKIDCKKFKIVQISDLHLGQYIHHEDRLKRIVELVNQQHPDLIVITGDMICSFAQEMRPFIPYLSKLHADYGVYAIHGNHDYGDYFWWNNNQEKVINHLLLEVYYQQAHIQLLNNKNIRIDNLPIYLAGMENIGKKPYPCYGNLAKALKNLPANDFIVFLSHDPVNWSTVIKEYPQVDLTLSGHTHAFQFGIDYKNIKWSPFASRNPWDGLYKHNNQYLYITHGLGSGLFSPRVGMWPEITVINLIGKK